jgi:hypothetical protein
MKKIKRYLLSITPLLLAIFIAYFGYINIPTTPVLIIVIFILFISIIWSIGLFKKDYSVAEKLIELKTPELEEGLIYIIPQDFAEKSDAADGKLFIAGSEFDLAPFSYTHATYKKLTDELTISFAPQLELVIEGIKTIGIGDYQFCIFGFSKMAILKNKKNVYTYEWKDDFLGITTDNEEKYVTLEDGGATLIFAWENSIIDNE